MLIPAGGRPPAGEGSTARWAELASGGRRAAGATRRRTIGGAGALAGAAALGACGVSAPASGGTTGQGTVCSSKLEMMVAAGPGTPRLRVVHGRAEELHPAGMQRRALRRAQRRIARQGDHRGDGGDALRADRDGPRVDASVGGVERPELGRRPVPAGQALQGRLPPGDVEDHELRQQGVVPARRRGERRLHPVLEQAALQRGGARPGEGPDHDRRAGRDGPEADPGERRPARPAGDEAVGRLRHRQLAARLELRHGRPVLRRGEGRADLHPSPGAAGGGVDGGLGQAPELRPGAGLPAVGDGAGRAVLRQRAS